MKFRKLIISLGLLSLSIVIQAQEPINYQQRFKSAVDILDSCQECAVKQLLEIKAAQYAPEKVRINSTIVLANISVNTGNIESLDVFLKDIEQYLSQHPENVVVSSTLERLKGYRRELSQQQESFRDRLVGTWVTAEAYHISSYPIHGFPFVIMDIKRSEDGVFTATRYECWTNSKKDIPEHTENVDIDGSSKSIGIHFGTEKIKKAKTEYAQSLMNSVRQNAKESAETKARTGYSDYGKDLSNIFLTILAKDAATAKSTKMLRDFFLKELTPNILFGRFYYEYNEERSDGKEGESYQKVRDLFLYRITPNDSITFVFPHNWGYWACKLNPHCADYNDIKGKLPRNEKLSVKDLNLKAYSNLRHKIMKYVTTLNKEEAEQVTAELEYGPQGFSWNDGYYVADEADATLRKYSYDERFKGLYKRGSRGINVVDNYETIHDYWRGFDRNYDFVEYYDFKTKFKESGVPKYFKMKKEIDAKNQKKNKKGKEEE